MENHTRHTNLTRAFATLLLACSLPAVAQDGEWIFCSNEYDTCTVPSEASVRYGANGTYNTIDNVTGSIDCGNAVFGDPVYGVVNQCEYRLVTTEPANEQVTEPLAGLVREWWLNIQGTGINDLQASLATPPDGSETLAELAGPTNWDEDYGSRIRGILYAPMTGDYTFWISGDDNVELWLSTDGSVTNRQRIASVPGWTFPLEWETYPEQQSAAIPLVAGQGYYLEVLHKEGIGGDHVAVAWQRPDDPERTIIGGGFFTPPVTDTDSDGDGVPDSEDAFPDDPAETTDTDGDGTGDNADAFPGDPAETTDTDGDGIGDNADAFPDDPAETIDSDGDGVGDNADLFPDDPDRSHNDPVTEPPAGLTREWWLNIQGTGINDLQASLATPPDGSETLTELAGPTDWNDNYGSRIRGILYAPVSGDYTFWISGDDNVELWLSTDGSVTNRQRIASVPGWTFPREWESYPEQQSAAIPLVAGQGYYLEALHKEGVGGDHVAVAWQRPDDPGRTIIGGGFFTPPVTDTDSDGDGVPDSEDAFPDDPTQSADADGDGQGDNRITSRGTAYTYDDHGNVLTEDGPRTDVNDVTGYSYDDLGNRTRITNALGHVIRLTDYNGRGQPQTVTDANGVETRLTYHVRGWLESVTVVDPGGDSSLDTTTLYGYDAVGQLIRITLPSGTVLNYTYDGARRLTAISNSPGDTISYTLDNAGNRTAEVITDASGTIHYTMTRAYDELSRVMDIIGAGGQTTHLDYDVNDNNTAITNPRQHTTSQVYDPLDRLTRTTGPDNSVTRFGYDALDRLTSVTDANGNTTTYTYDAFDNLTRIDSPDTGTVRYVYDNAGNRLIGVDSRGIVSRYTYDALNRLTAVDYPGAPGENISYTYDQGANGIGRLTGIDDHSGSTRYRYDHRGNLIEKTVQLDTLTLVTRYGYGPGNNLTRITYPGGTVVRYTRDSQGRVGSITTQIPGQDEQALAGNTLYLPFGPVTRMEYGNDLTSQARYDQDYRLTGLTTGTVLDMGYSYDANGNILAIDHLQTANDQTFGYDALDRLLNSTGHYDDLAYRYDPVGNRLGLARNNEEALYNYILGSNTLADIQHPDSRENVTYQSDSHGNTTRRVQGNRTLDLRYNAANRLDQVTETGQGSTRYTYNALGQRTRKADNSTTQYYLYDEQGLLLGEYDDNGNALTEYVWFNGQPLAQLKGNQVYYYHNDHLGTPRVLTDQNQQVVWEARYTPFGEASVSTETITNNLRFPGQYFDSETNLHYNWHRYYDPTAGRYITSDPIGLGDGPNPYLYAQANPLFYYDPNGQAAIGYTTGQGAAIGSAGGPIGAFIGGAIGFGIGLAATDAFLDFFDDDDAANDGEFCPQDDDECDKLLEDMVLLFKYILSQINQGMDARMLISQYNKQAAAACRLCPEICQDIPRFR